MRNWNFTISVAMSSLETLLDYIVRELFPRIWNLILWNFSFLFHDLVRLMNHLIFILWKLIFVGTCMERQHHIERLKHWLILIEQWYHLIKNFIFINLEMVKVWVVNFTLLLISTLAIYPFDQNISLARANLKPTSFLRSLILVQMIFVFSFTFF